MLSKESKETFLVLVRKGIGMNGGSLPDNIDWKEVEVLANQQGLWAIMSDGLDKVTPGTYQIPDMIKKRWIGEVLKCESNYAVQQKAACEMALMFHRNDIRTYVLKGSVIAECYPNPSHRQSADLDCFLLPSHGLFNAWDLGNSLIKEKGFEVGLGFYKNSSFYLPGLMVENHKFLTPFRGNKKLTALENVLQALLRQDAGDDKFEEAWLYRPPVMVSALFLVEHAYSHFLHEGLTWRLVLDWMMFMRRHQAEINWTEFDGYLDEFGLRKFYDAYLRIGCYLFGELDVKELSNKEIRLLSDIWAPLDLHETLHGVKGKLSLVGNTLRARWKYRLFGDISMLHALRIQVIGVLFIKNPKLD